MAAQATPPMYTLPPPPPRRTVSPPSKPEPILNASGLETIPKEGWKAWSKRKSLGWGKTAVDKGVVISNNVGNRANGLAESLGSERFWPTTGDFPLEMEKAARILRAFTVDGIEHTVEEKSVTGLKKQHRVMKKIPSRIVRSAKGLAIFTSMRSGIAPFGGAGGCGLIVAKLPEGTWSAPSSMSPNNATVGFLLGADIYDAVLVIRTESALKTFMGHKITLGTEIAAVAGPYGAGAAVEVGLDKSPVLSYVRSRGLYAGFEAVGQVFIERFDENEKQYWWPGVRASDILTGSVAVPLEAASLMEALADAETGRAQRQKGLENEFEEPFPEIPEDLELGDGEVLRLPPTPNQTLKEEQEEEELWRLEEIERITAEKMEEIRLGGPPDPERKERRWEEEDELQGDEREARVLRREMAEDRKNRELAAEGSGEDEGRRAFERQEEMKRLA